VIISDITDSKRIQQKNFEGRKHYLSVIDTIRDGIFVVDKNLKILSYNKFFAEKVKLPIKTIKDKECSLILLKYENDLFSKEFIKEKNISSLIKKVFIKGKFKTFEKKISFKKKVFYYKIEISPTKDKKGQVYQAVITINNITKNREDEEEIRRLDEFKNRVLNNVPVSITMLDKKGKIISLNNYAKELMGEELLNLKLIATKEIKSNKKLVSLYNDLIKKGKPFKYENLVYYRNKGESVGYLNLIAAPLLDAKGRVEGAISIAVDNTEAKMYREKIENLNQELEKKVEKRTAELDEVNKKLNEALELKLKFISDASHELRTPLTIMKGNLDLLFLEDKKIEPSLLGVYSDLEDEIARMSQIISELTMLTNADSEIEKLCYDKVDIYKLTRLIIKSLSIIAKEKNISIKFSYILRPIYVMGDENKLDKLIMNLIRNAIKYTDQNGWIKISLSKNNNEVTLKISVIAGCIIPINRFKNIFIFVKSLLA
jgi:PAS domain S-box-containing protein